MGQISDWIVLFTAGVDFLNFNGFTEAFSRRGSLRSSITSLDSGPGTRSKSEFILQDCPCSQETLVEYVKGMQDRLCFIKYSILEVRSYDTSLLSKMSFKEGTFFLMERKKNIYRGRSCINKLLPKTVGMQAPYTLCW